MAGHMKDMAYTDDDKTSAYGESLGIGSSGPDYPPGLCICLDEKELRKMEPENEPEVGDVIHMVVMAKVTSISKREDHERIELQITHIGPGVENESEEEPGED